MCSRNLSISSSIVIVLLVLYSVDQASARRCYGCESTSSGLCWKNPVQAPTGVCLPTKSLTSDSTASSANTTIQAAMAALGHETDVAANYYASFDCAKFVGTFKGYDYVLRMCTIEQIPCSAYVNKAAEIGFRVSSCDRCSSDLCNSSNNINAGIMSLIVFAMLFFFQK